MAALDRELKDRILTCLQEVVARWNVPTIFVSHDQDDVRRFADKVIVLDNGRVVEGALVAQRPPV